MRGFFIENFTPMVDTIALARALTGLIGLHPTLSAGGDLVADYHKEPVMYLDDAHKLLRPEILSALGPNVDEVRVPAYDVSTTYSTYDVVADTDGALYESVVKANTNHPVMFAEYWKPTTLLSAWYGRIERGAINKLVLLATGSPATVPLLDNQMLFAKEGNRSDTINKQGRFLGWAIYVNGVDTALEIVRSGLQLLGAVEDFPVYIFHSSQDEPVATIRYTGTSSGRSLWADINRYLYQRIGGYYVIGYYEDDLPDGVFAIGSQRSFNVVGCGGCGGGVDQALIESRAPYVAIQPIYINGPLERGVMSWEQTNEMQVASQSWGLNLVISAKCDATRSILNNKEQLTRALLYMIACDVLEELSTTDRVNVIAKEANSQAYIALNGQKDTDGGLKADRKAAIADLKDVLSKISGCTPIAPRQGIGISSMWG